jgi:hypothetical protein
VTELPDNVSLEWIGRRLIAIGDDLSVLPAIAAVGVAMAIPLQQPVNAQSVTCNPKKGCSLWARPDCLVLYPNLTASAADFAL